MRIYSFNKEYGTEVVGFNSKGIVFTKIIKHDKPVHIGCIYQEPEGNLGEHIAPVNQLFLVLNGQGWVSGSDRIKCDIKPGKAAFWEAGEMHESGSELGMTVIIIEGEDLVPLLKED